MHCAELSVAYDFPEDGLHGLTAKAAQQTKHFAKYHII